MITETVSGKDGSGKMEISNTKFRDIRTDQFHLIHVVWKKAHLFSFLNKGVVIPGQTDDFPGYHIQCQWILSA